MMTMTVDTNQQRFGPLSLDHMSYPNHPQFTNPWASSTSGPQSSNHAVYVTSQEGLPAGLGLNSIMKHEQPDTRTSTSGNASMASYGSSIPVTAASAGSPLMTNSIYGQQDLLSMPQGQQPHQQHLLSINRVPHQTTSAAYGPNYVTASPVHPTYPPTSSYDMGYTPSASVRGQFTLAPEPDQSRRYSQSSVPPSTLLGSSNLPAVNTMVPRTQQRNPLADPSHSGVPNDDRRSFADALEASHGMLSMSQETPRNIYGRGRGSADSYGFPSAHSTSSSISSTGIGSYYGGSVDSSVSDYSTAGSDIESVTGRTLPRPQGFMANQGPPPAPQSMMSQFSSKVSSSTQKKHKCKVCDKRFTRPSSLQTHMYSHTGEKRELNPFPSFHPIPILYTATEV